MIDCFASESQFADHLLPIYNALDDPGDFLVSGRLMESPGRWPAKQTPTDSSRPVLVASFGDVKRVRKQGRTRIARIEHGIGQNYGTNHGSYAGGKNQDDVSLFLMPNRYSAERWTKTYPEAQVEVIGSPRLDSLPARDASPGPTIAISFHWDCYLVEETRSALAHYRGILRNLNAEFRLIGHGHPRALAGTLTRMYRRAEIEVVPDFDDVCRRADVYVCDNSSSMYEFAATGRPVVTLNAPWYRRDYHPGLRFWEAADVGVQVDHPSDLPAAIRLALADGPTQRTNREAALNMVYAYRSGASQRAASILQGWATETGTEEKVA